MQTSEKQALRRAMYARVAAFCAAGDAAKAASAQLCSAVQALAAFREADVVLAYLATAKEADCTALIAAALAAQQQVALPRVIRGTSDMDFYLLTAASAGASPLADSTEALPSLSTQLAAQTEIGSYGIREPKTTLTRFEPERASGRVFVIVPGVAFTTQGARLGHGKGFYDRYLARLLQSAAQVTCCGVCFQVQLAQALPCDAHDMPMQFVVTESDVHASGVSV